jgi:phage terminase small subunit
MKLNTQSPRPGDESFNYYWELLLSELKERPNLCNSHLTQLKVLCDANVQYDVLLEKVNKEGHILTKITSQGESFITNPHVNQLNRVINQIKDYSKMLGLVLEKEAVPTGQGDDEEDWT